MCAYRVTVCRPDTRKLIQNYCLPGNFYTRIGVRVPALLPLPFGVVVSVITRVHKHTGHRHCSSVSETLCSIFQRLPVKAVVSGTRILFKSVGKKPKIGTAMPFKSFIGTLKYCTRERASWSSDWPAPDRTCCWLKKCWYTSLCLLKLGFTYFWLQLYP